MRTFPSVDAYIAAQPEEVQVLLKKIRKVVMKAAPMAEEKMSYGMPAYKWNGVLAYVGAFKGHISLFHGGASMKSFEKQLKNYKQSKGGVMFPLDEPIPYDLIEEIIKFKVGQNMMNG